MTLKELAASREKIIDYYKNIEAEKRENYYKNRESGFVLGEPDIKPDIKNIFSDLIQEEEVLLQNLFNFLPSIYYSTEGSINKILDLAENPKFCDRTITEDDTLKHIRNAVLATRMNEFEYAQLEDNLVHSQEYKKYSEIYETFFKDELKGLTPYIEFEATWGQASKFENLLEKMGIKYEYHIEDENSVTDLQKTLYQYGMEKEAQQVSLLLEQISEVQKNYSEVFQELETVRNQFNQLQGMLQKTTQGNLVNQLAAFENDVQKQYQQIQLMGKQMNEKADICIQKVKEVGIKALNNVCTFLGIKETLVKMSDMTQSNAAKAKRIIEKIDIIENEFKNAGVHIQNIGRAIAGKEALNSVSEKQSKIFQGLKKHCQRNLDIFEKRAEKLNIAIKKIIDLEQVSGRVSIREKLEENKSVIAAKEALKPIQEKEKPLQTDLSR